MSRQSANDRIPLRFRVVHDLLPGAGAAAVWIFSALELQLGFDILLPMAILLVGVAQVLTVLLRWGHGRIATRTMGAAAAFGVLLMSYGAIQLGSYPSAGPAVLNGLVVMLLLGSVVWWARVEASTRNET